MGDAAVAHCELSDAHLLAVLDRDAIGSVLPVPRDVAEARGVDAVRSEHRMRVARQREQFALERARRHPRLPCRTDRSSCRPRHLPRTAASDRCRGTRRRLRRPRRWCACDRSLRARAPRVRSRAASRGSSTTLDSGCRASRVVRSTRRRSRRVRPNAAGARRRMPARPDHPSSARRS